jgi:hypothetical protein
MGNILVPEGIKFSNRAHEHKLRRLQQKANIYRESEEVEDLFACPF